MRTSRAALLAAVLASPSSAAGELRGWAGLEWRGFVQPAAQAGQRRLGVSLVLEPEYRWSWGGGRRQLVLRPFLRFDSSDRARSHVDLREAYWREAGTRWEWSLGVRRVFWGVTESQHLVDVVNQTDLVEDPDGEDKLGQPLASVAARGSWGRLEALLLPLFRERSFPGSRGRLRYAPPVAEAGAVYAGGSGRAHLDWAVRWSRRAGPWDVGLVHFAGTGREPALVPGRDRLVPVYRPLAHTGADVQLTHGPVLAKLELVTRREDGQRHVAGTVGFEYTIGVVGGADLGLLVEYLHDSRGRDGPAPFQDDVFVGARLSLNDVRGTTLLAGAIVDRRSGASLASLEASRRLSGRLRLNLTARGFLAVPADDRLGPLRRDSYLQLELVRHF